MQTHEVLEEESQRSSEKIEKGKKERNRVGSVVNEYEDMGSYLSDYILNKKGIKIQREKDWSRFRDKYKKERHPKIEIDKDSKTKRDL